MPDPDHDVRTLQMLYRGSVAAVLFYEWAMQRCPVHRGELLAIRDLHHVCQMLIEERIHHHDADPDPEVLTGGMEMLAHMGESDPEGIRTALMSCEHLGWQALVEALADASSDLRAFLDEEIKGRADEALSRMTALAERLTCDDR